MNKNAQSAVQAFVNLFPKDERKLEPLPEYKVEDNSDVLFTHLRFAEMIFPDGGIMLCPISHVYSRYVGINCERVLGVPHDTLLKMSLQDFFQMIHPEDLPAVQQCYGFIKKLEPFDPATLRFAVRYRTRNGKGEYVHIRNENLAIKTANNTYLYLMVFTNVTDEEKFYQVTLDVFRQVKGNFIKSYTYCPKHESTSITPRQNDIAQLIAKGFTNQEIADQLFLSVYTVKNHKQMLFKKANVKNSIELANYIRQNPS